MAWIKHHDNVTNSVLISQLISDLGPEGYGRYWLLMELLRSEWKIEDQFINVHFSEIHRTLRFYKKTMTKQFLNNRSIVHIFFKDCYGIPTRLFKDCSKIPQGLSEILLDKKQEVYTFNSQILFELADRDSKYNKKRAANYDEVTTLDKIREDKKREDTLMPDTIIELFNTKLKGKGNIQQCLMFSSESAKNFVKLKKEHPQFKKIETWETAFDAISKSEFLKGNSKSGWVLTLGWLLQEKNMENVLNGGFSGNNNGFNLDEWKPEKSEATA